jgi:hypothetical protein
MMPIRDCTRSFSFSALLLILTGGTFATGQTAPDIPPAEATTMFPYPDDSR